jgi:hypothetical protein
MRLLKYLPRQIVKNRIMRPNATTENCPLYWIEKNVEGKINAFFGSKEKWENIPGWDNYEFIVDQPYIKLNHGYDENRKDEECTLDDIKRAAEFRGGKCLSTSMKIGDLTTKLKWVCAHGHEFKASSYLILKTGHWCEECVSAPWTFDEIAKKNPFIAQVWHVDHDKHENNVYE